MLILSWSSITFFPQSMQWRCRVAWQADEGADAYCRTCVRQTQLLLQWDAQKREHPSLSCQIAGPEGRGAWQSPQRNGANNCISNTGLRLLLKGPVEGHTCWPDSPQWLLRTLQWLRKLEEIWENLKRSCQNGKASHSYASLLSASQYLTRRYETRRYILRSSGRVWWALDESKGMHFGGFNSLDQCKLP